MFKSANLILRTMAWVAIAAIILGAVILKSIINSDTKIHRCPYCNLVLRKNQTPCPRCRNQVGWD